MRAGRKKALSASMEFTMSQILLTRPVTIHADVAFNGHNVEPSPLTESVLPVSRPSDEVIDLDRLLEDIEWHDSEVSLPMNARSAPESEMACDAALDDNDAEFLQFMNDVEFLRTLMSMRSRKVSPAFRAKMNREIDQTLERMFTCPWIGRRLHLRSYQAS